MEEISFKGKISKMGKGKMVWIPKDLLENISDWEYVEVRLKRLRLV